MQGHAQIQGKEAEFMYSKCIREGSVEAAKLFTPMILDAISKTIKFWDDQAYGLEFNARRLLLLIWADNFWLFNTSRAQLRSMIKDLAQALSISEFTSSPNRFSIYMRGQAGG